MSNAMTKKLDQKLDALTPGTLRYQVVLALKRFRSSWVELGRFLNEVVYGGDYREWGYDDFVVYCARELGLKKPTVQKLMVSYNYMKKYESGRLAQCEASDADNAVVVPDYQTVALLDKVRENTTPDAADAAHRRVFNGACEDADETDVRKELRLMLNPRIGSNSIDSGNAMKKELAGVLRAAREFRKKLSAAPFIPEGLVERLLLALTELEALE